MKFIEFGGLQSINFPTHHRHVEHEFLGFCARRFNSLLEKLVEHFTNGVFVSFLPELLELFSKRGIGWSPVKDREGLVELVGTCLALGLSGQIEQVGLRPRTWEKASWRWCLAILDFLFVFFIPSNNTLFETMSGGRTAPKKRYKHFYAWPWFYRTPQKSWGRR